MLGRVKLDNTLLTCDPGNFNQRTARNRDRTMVTVVKGGTTTVPPTPLTAGHIISAPLCNSTLRKLSYNWTHIVALQRPVTLLLIQ